MKSEIEFLTSREKTKQELTKLSSFKALPGFVAVFIYCFVIIGLITYVYYLKNQQQDLAGQINLKKEQLESFKKTETLHISLKQRLTSIKTLVVNDKNRFDQILTTLKQVFPPGTIIEQIELSVDGQTQVGVSISDLNSLVTVINNLAADNPDSIFAKITVDSLSKNDDGGYQLEFEIQNDAKT